MNEKKILAFVQIFLVVSLAFASLSFNSKKVSAQEEQQVCCEKDNSGNYCSYVPANECTGSNVLKAATSCDQTSFCKAGTCAGIDGFCYDNYPKALCESRDGNFYSSKSDSVVECKLGCCIIGTQAAFLTKNRCIEETGSFPDLEVDFRDDVKSEQECLNLAKNQEQGCCVRSDGCAFGAKSECNIKNIVNGTGFYKDTFCSDSKLRNLCTCASHPDPKKNLALALKSTMCLPDRDEVYWKDSCGNPEGIVGDNEADKQIDLRKFGGSRAGGDCDYNKGNLCSDSNKDGIHVCESLDCESGNSNNDLSVNLEGYVSAKGLHGTDPREIKEDEILNGESWCVFDSNDQKQDEKLISTSERAGKDPVGSRYYRSLCINGQELVEPCKDFREEYCFSNTLNVELAQIESRKYTEARCLKNEWQPCVNQCNTANPLTMNKHNYKEALEKDQQCCLSANRDCAWTGSKCVPSVSPGFKFWEGEGADVCGRASTECTAVFVCGGWNRVIGCETGEIKSGFAGAAAGGLGPGWYTWAALGGPSAPVVVSAVLGATLVGFGTSQSGWHIVSGGECFSQEYLQASNNLCRSYGDCGSDFNYLVDDGLDNKFTLSNSGFSNTNNIGEDFANYARENEGKLSDKAHGNLDLSFGPSGKGFDSDDPVPGNLSEPKWDQGKEFFSFTRPTEKPEGGFVGVTKRGLVTEGLFGQWWLSPASLSAFTLLGGLGSAISSKITVGLGAEIGLTSSPLGFLVGTVLGFAGVEAFENQLGKSIAKATAKGVLDEAAKKAQEKIGGNIFTVSNNKITGIVESAADETVKGLSKQVIGKTKEQGLKIVKEEVGKKARIKAAQGSFSAYMTGISAALWAYTIFQLGSVIFEDVKTVGVKTTCQPWQAPTFRTTSPQDDPCQRCNPDFSDYVDEDGNAKNFRAKQRCSEYRCKSLGVNCELINKGTAEENCVTVNKLDTNSPQIKPWEEGFSLDLKKFKIEETETGFRIKNIDKSDEEGIDIYTPFAIGLQTDEPSQCKISMQHSRRYQDMENTFFGNNLFTYFHTNTMVYPSSKGVNQTGLTLSGGGDYELYLRCLDASGNANEKDYVIEFKIKDEPDLTAPTIVGSSLAAPGVLVGEQNIIGNEVYLTNKAEYIDVTLLLNEPSECRYSYTPLEFNLMNESTKCVSSSGVPDASPYYTCRFVKDVGLPYGPAPSGFVSEAGLVKYVYFKCRDHPEVGYQEQRNFNRDAYAVTLRGSNPLNITSVGPSENIKTSTAVTNVTLRVETSNGAKLDGTSVCKYTTDESAKENIVAMTEFLNTGGNVHIQPWQPGSGEQKFYVGCYDKAGNIDYGQIAFSVEHDVNPPFITKVYRDQSEPPQFIVELNEPGECKDSTEGTFDYETSGNLMNALDSEGKRFSSTNYNSNIYYVICRDKFGNTMTPAVVQLAVV